MPHFFSAGQCEALGDDAEVIDELEASHSSARPVACWQASSERLLTVTEMGLAEGIRDCGKISGDAEHP